MTAKQAKARTLEDFGAAYDRNIVIPNKIRVALAQMEQEGPEHWETEIEFIKRSGVSVGDLSLYREQFQKHWVEAKMVGTGRDPKRIWFGNVKAAEKVRK